MIQAGYVRSAERRATRETAFEAVAPQPETEVIVRSGGAYGEARQPRWAMMGIILGLHAALLGALAFFDVVHIGHKKHMPRLTVVEIQPEKITPPPAPARQQKAPDKPVEQPIVTPPPIIQIAAPAPPLVTTPVPPPPAPEPVSAAPPSSAPVSAAAAPVSAPDGTARNLGNPSPKYPMEARRNHWEGVVRLRVVITPEGRVKEIAVAKSSGFDALDNEALKTVGKWKFLPGKQAGVAVEAVGFLSIPFHLT